MSLPSEREGLPPLQEAIDRVEIYRNMLRAIDRETPADPEKRDSLYVEAGHWYEKNVRRAGFSDAAIRMAWFMNSSENEWPWPDEVDDTNMTDE